MPRFFLNSSRGLYRHPHGSGDPAAVLRRCTNRKPLTFGFPLVSSAASHSTHPACRSGTSWAQLSHRQPDRMDLPLVITLTIILPCELARGEVPTNKLSLTSRCVQRVTAFF